jgi:hypothetical protein
MRAVQSLHKDSSLTGVWPGHHRDKGDPEFARRQVQRGRSAVKKHFCRKESSVSPKTIPSIRQPLSRRPAI